MPSGVPYPVGSYRACSRYCGCVPSPGTSTIRRWGPATLGHASPWVLFCPRLKPSGLCRNCARRQMGDRAKTHAAGFNNGCCGDLVDTTGGGESTQASTMLMVTDPKPSSGQNTTANHGHDVTHKVPGSPRQSPTPAVPLPITEPISPPMARSTNGDRGPSQPTSPLDPMLLSGPSAISTPDTATCMDLLGSPVDPNPEDPTQNDTITELQQFLDEYDGDLFSTLQ